MTDQHQRKNTSPPKTSNPQFPQHSEFVNKVFNWFSKKACQSEKRRSLRSLFDCFTWICFSSHQNGKINAKYEEQEVQC